MDNIASVASFFLSRIDSKVDDALDKRLEAGADAELVNSIKGKVAIANAKIAYQAYEEIFGSDRWQALADKGASPQRLLWGQYQHQEPRLQRCHVC